MSFSYSVYDCIPVALPSMVICAIDMDREASKARGR